MTSTETMNTAAELLRTYGSLVTLADGLQVATGHGHADRIESAWGYARVER